MRILLAVLLLVLPAPLLALSCLPYSAEQAFQDVQEAEDEYVVAVGILEFNPAHLPKAGSGTKGASFAANMVGFALTGDGFNARFVRTIRVDVQCVGAWCGIVRPGERYLTFLKRKDAGFVLADTPCKSLAFPNPSDSDLDRVHGCFLGRACAP